ncbi:MAG: low molecular weight protein arginine phosphatase [Gemmatimonadota bacterium]
MHVLFVCSGNTCRSPLAEVAFRRLLHEAGRSDITVSSAGTGAYNGSPASEGTFLVGLEEGLDLSAHRAKLLDEKLVAEADLILTMARGHHARVCRLGGEGRVWLLGDYAGAVEPVEVRDPFGGEVSVYRDTLEQLTGLLTTARDRLLAEHPA